MNRAVAAVKDQLHSLYKKAECADHPLLYLFMEITRKCNLHCRHCGSDCSSIVTAPSLTTPSWLTLIDTMADTFRSKPAINLTGGEPLLHEDFPVIVKRLFERNFRWGIVSNGYVLDKPMLDLLTGNGVTSITISLDGTEESHNWLRCNNQSYSRAVAAIRMIALAGIEHSDVVTCVNPLNLDQLDSVAKVLIDNGVKAWRLFRIFPAGRGGVNKELHLSFDATQRLLDWIADRKSLFAKQGLDINLSCEGWLPFAENSRVRDQPFFCRAGINIASILHDGTITGCSNNASQFYEGSVLSDNFAYIWEHGFRKFRKRDWISNSSCGTCCYVKKCQGGSVHLWRDGFEAPAFCYVKR
jgi:radical SAM protein with 4Fe4S-binding SPASM domain